MRINNENLLELDGTATDSDLSANIDLKPCWLGHICNYSIQLVFTGSPQGNFKLQMSNDPGKPNASSEAEKYVGITNWTDIADSAQTISAAGDHAWQVENAGYTWVRVVWTATGGSGTLTSARANVKGN